MFPQKRNVSLASIHLSIRPSPIHPSIHPPPSSILHPPSSIYSYPSCTEAVPGITCHVLIPAFLPATTKKSREILQLPNPTMPMRCGRPRPNAIRHFFFNPNSIRPSLVSSIGIHSYYARDSFLQLRQITWGQHVTSPQKKIGKRVVVRANLLCTSQVDFLLLLPS